MTIRDLFTIRMLAGCAPVLAFALVAGCSQQQAAEQVSAPAAQPAVVIVPPTTPPVEPVANVSTNTPKAQPEPAKQPEPKAETPGPTFAFSPDLTGNALLRVVAPDLLRTLPADKNSVMPKPRT